MVQDGIKISPGIDQPVLPSSQPTQQKNSKSVTSNVPEEEVQVPVQKKLDPELLAKVTEELNENFRIFNTSINFSTSSLNSPTEFLASSQSIFPSCCFISILTLPSAHLCIFREEFPMRDFISSII